MSAQSTEHSRPRSGEPDSPPGAEPGADDTGRIGVSGTQVAASVLASVSAAVIASFFGVAGTIVGTAVVSVVATVGSAAYGLGIRRTTDRLQQVQALRVPLPPRSRRASGADPTVSDPTGADATAADPTVGDSSDDGSAGDDAAPATTVVNGPSSAGWAGWLAQRRWSVAAGVAIVFVVSLATVTLIEAVGDGPLSGETSGAGRTSVGALLPGGGGSDDDADDTDDTDDTDAIDPGAPVTTVPPAGSPSTTADDAGADRSSPTTTAPSGTTTSTAPTTSTTAPPTTTTTVPQPTTTTVPVPTTVGPPGAG
jgi:hypothetical protein